MDEHAGPPCTSTLVRVLTAHSAALPASPPTFFSLFFNTISTSLSSFKIHNSLFLSSFSFKHIAFFSLSFPALYLLVLSLSDRPVLSLSPHHHHKLLEHRHQLSLTNPQLLSLDLLSSPCHHHHRRSPPPPTAPFLHLYKLSLSRVYQHQEHQLALCHSNSQTSSESVLVIMSPRNRALQLPLAYDNFYSVHPRPPPPPSS